MNQEPEAVPLPDSLIVYFDGSCTKPGGRAVGAYRILDSAGKMLVEWRAEVCNGPGATNNVAEWAALEFALKWLNRRDWKGSLTIHGDSQLVICQLAGEYQCRKEHLKPYLESCRNLLKDVTWQATWVPREQNTEADALSKSTRPKKGRK